MLSLWTLEPGIPNHPVLNVLSVFICVHSVRGCSVKGRLAGFPASLAFPSHFTELEH